MSVLAYDFFFRILLFLFVSFTRDKQRYTIILVLQFLHKKRIQDEKKENEKRERRREKKKKEKKLEGEV